MVSIIIPIYHTDKYLDKTIQSLEGQTLQDFEVILINDGKFDLSRFSKYTIVECEHKNAAHARNEGVKHAHGKYLLFLDSDDYISKNFLEECVKVLDGDDTVSCVIPVCLYFGNEQQTVIPKWESYRKEIVMNSVFETSMIRKKDFDRIGGFDEDYDYCEDWEMFIRLLYHNDNVACCDSIRLYYRRHGNQTTEKNNATDFFRLRQKLFKKHKEKYGEYEIYTAS